MNIFATRLNNQQISRPSFETPAEVVQRLGAVQAQDYAAAKWAIGLRMKNGVEAAVDQALAEGIIIRTQVLRPTWHFVTPADIRWMLALSARRIHAAMSYNYRRFGLDEPAFKRSQSVFIKELQGGKELTRLELASMLKQKGIHTDNLGTLHLLLEAEVKGIICSGGRRGKQFTYALLEERAPQALRLKHEEALAELTLRYFTSHGPATAHDYAWWSGLTLANARSGIELIKSQLVNEVAEGQTYWFAATSPEVKNNPHTAYLLPAYDEYTVGYSDRSTLIETQHAEKLTAWNVFLLNPGIVINGKIAGNWKRTFKKNTVVIELKLLRSLTKTEARDLEATIERYGRFLNMPTVVIRS